MILFPALDLLAGKVVRLLHGERTAATVYSDDPAAVAQRWQAEGAEWLHVVDLDRAFGDGRDNREAVRAIAAAVTIPFQLGGGLRSSEAVEEAIGLGAARVLVGTRAALDREWLAGVLELHGDRVAVALDARKGQIEISGWTESTSLRAGEFALDLKRMGAERIVVTDIERDGALAGVNAGLAERLARDSGLKVIASGGTAGTADLERLRLLAHSGIEGVVVGRALYEGVFTLAEARRLLQGED